MDRAGPDHDPFINPDGEKDLDNTGSQPTTWPTTWARGPRSWKTAATRQRRPGRQPQVLPDILRYDRTQPASYPDGRMPTDDVYSMRFAWLSHGKVPPTGLKPHEDLLDEFPYLASRPVAGTGPIAASCRHGIGTS